LQGPCRPALEAAPATVLSEDETRITAGDNAIQTEAVQGVVEAKAEA
jgi:hypothetical protein